MPTARHQDLAAPRVRLADAVSREIRAVAVAAWPGEAVCALFGVARAELWTVHTATVLPNLARDRHRFDGDAWAFARAEHDARRLGWQHLGFFHSHPGPPARPRARSATARHSTPPSAPPSAPASAPPSAEDLAHHWPGTLMAISASGADSATEPDVWWVTAGRAVACPPPHPELDP